MRKINRSFENPIDNIILDIGIETLPMFKSLGFTPNGLTTVSLIFGLMSVYSLFYKSNMLFAVYYLISYFFDSIDGLMARKYNMVSKFGDMYDHIKDCFVFSLIIIVLLYKYPFNKNILLYSLIAISYILSLIHLDCQEKIYGKSNESSFLGMLGGLCTGKNTNLEKKTKITRYFGIGTATLILVIVPFYLKSKRR
jgi:phosphatidylglycerophosphate synthase